MRRCLKPYWNLAIRDIEQQNLQICAVSYTCRIANDSLYNPLKVSVISAGHMTYHSCENLLTARGVCHFDETLTRCMPPGAIIHCLSCILWHTNIQTDTMLWHVITLHPFPVPYPSKHSEALKRQLSNLVQRTRVQITGVSCRLRGIASYRTRDITSHCCLLLVFCGNILNYYRL